MDVEWNETKYTKVLARISTQKIKLFAVVKNRLHPRPLASKTERLFVIERKKYLVRGKAGSFYRCISCRADGGALLKKSHQ